MAKIKPVFTGEVKNSKIQFDDDIAYQIWIADLNGKRVRVIVEQETYKRTDPQNKYYWGVVVEILSQELGYETEEVHNLLKSMFLKRRVILKGKEYISIGSTAKLNTAQFTDYIEKIKRFASMELSIIIPESENVSI
jgi:hypothetical protein